MKYNRIEQGSLALDLKALKNMLSVNCDSGYSGYCLSLAAFCSRVTPVGFIQDSPNNTMSKSAKPSEILSRRAALHINDDLHINKRACT